MTNKSYKLPEVKLTEIKGSNRQNQITVVVTLNYVFSNLQNKAQYQS